MDLLRRLNLLTAENVKGQGKREIPRKVPDEEMISRLMTWSW